MAFTRLGDMPIGSIVKTPVNGTVREFIVIHHGGSTGAYNNATILLLKDPYELRAYHTSTDGYYYPSRTDMDAYLTTTFTNQLNANIKNSLKPVLISSRTKSETIPNSYIGEQVMRSAFALSEHEVGVGSSSVALSYFKDSTDVKRIAYLDGYATGWWLRNFPNTPSGYDPVRTTYIVRLTGELSTAGNNATYVAVRPALSFTSDIWVSSSGLLDVVGNTPPTAPGSITYDTPRAGKSLTITLTPATDPD